MSKLSETLDSLQILQEEYDEGYTNTVKLLDAIRLEHTDFAHEEHFRWCDRPACQLAKELDVRYPR